MRCLGCGCRGSTERLPLRPTWLRPSLLLLLLLLLLLGIIVFLFHENICNL